MPARLSSLLLACLLCTACVPGGVHLTPQPTSQLPSAPAWTYTDLRLLDPADASQPELDLLAVYLHTPEPGAAGRIELRLDFLDLGIDRQGDVYIALDYLPGGARDLPLEASADIEWDTLLRLPAEGNLLAYDSRIQPETRLGMRLLRDMAQDSLTLSLELPYPAPFTRDASPPPPARAGLHCPGGHAFGRRPLGALRALDSSAAAGSLAARFLEHIPRLHPGASLTPLGWRPHRSTGRQARIGEPAAHIPKPVDTHRPARPADARLVICSGLRWRLGAPGSPGRVRSAAPTR